MRNAAALFMSQSDISACTQKLLDIPQIREIPSATLTRHKDAV